MRGAPVQNLTPSFAAALIVAAVIGVSGCGGGGGNQPTAVAPQTTTQATTQTTTGATVDPACRSTSEAKRLPPNQDCFHGQLVKLNEKCPPFKDLYSYGTAKHLRCVYLNAKGPSRWTDAQAATAGPVHPQPTTQTTTQTAPPPRQGAGVPPLPGALPPEVATAKCHYAGQIVTYRGHQYYCAG